MQQTGGPADGDGNRKEISMKKQMAIVLVVLLAVGLYGACGCGGNGDQASDDIALYAGTYLSESNPSDFIEIMSNSTFTLLRDGEEISGSCLVEDGKLLLSAGSFSETMEIAEGVITAGDGTRYALGAEGKTESPEPADSASRKEAIDSYCRENGIVMDSLTLSAEREVSAEDPDWEIDYAFPAESEGSGQFFLLHRAGGQWAVVAHTEGGQTGWTAAELEALGAPSDLAAR